MGGMISRIRRRRRSGQTILFLAMVMVILAFIALWNFDFHKVLYVKAKSRNAGDAGALAGARWQGISLNIIGELNVMQALAITEELSRNGNNPDFSEAHAISELQARMSFTGPMLGVIAVNQAGKANNLFNNDDFASELLSHAAEVREYYYEDHGGQSVHSDRHR